MRDPLALPLLFRPVYMNIVWGGRRLAAWRADLPDGPVGESWDLADHARGMSVVADGPLVGQSLRQLTAAHGRSLVGDTYDGGDFPLLVKTIDANDRLSVQVHPDDALAQELGVGVRGKTECWLMLGEGGELFQGVVPGTTRAQFETALQAGQVSECLNRFVSRDGDFFFMPARTVHALGRGCLLVEVQQTCDVTFRVDDWGRVGLDGKPRPLHVRESLATIDFRPGISAAGPISAVPVEHPSGGSVRRLVQCPYFSVEERLAHRTGGGLPGACSIIVNLGPACRLATAAGEVLVPAMRTALVAASAGAWNAVSADGAQPLRLLVAHPV